MLYELGLKALANHQVLPPSILRLALGRALFGTELSLCLHRIRFEGGPDSAVWETMIDAAELDELLEILLAARPNAGKWLTICFDDGYADAGRYIESRAPRFPTVTWLLFVCPEKLVKRAGFRWDLPKGAPGSDVFGPPLDVRAENDRTDLRALGDRADCRLMTVEECRRVVLQPNVFLGNHTNCHFRQALLTLEDSRYDVEKSRREFEDLFGPTEHFAFPFGTPGLEFGDSHVGLARDCGYTRVWSTEPRPFYSEEGSTGALPRYPIFGTWPAAKNALLILMQALKWRWRGRKGDPTVKSSELEV
jgi:hypothetical protein